MIKRRITIKIIFRLLLSVAFFLPYQLIADEVEMNPLVDPEVELKVQPEPQVEPQPEPQPQVETQLESLPEVQTEAEQIDGSQFEWVEKGRHYIGKKVKKMTGSLDDFISRDYSPSVNESFMRMRLGYVFEEGGSVFPNNSVKLKVDLPKSENKWSLVFETDSEDFQSLEEKNNSERNKNQGIKNTSGATGALKFLLNKDGNWKNDFDVGVKAPLPLNAFVRFNMKRRYRVTDIWTARLKHSIYDFAHEGFGENSQFYLERALGPNWYFTNLINMQWRDVGQIWEFSETVSWTHTPDDRNRFSYNIGQYYQEQPSPMLQSYIVNASYRRCVHRDWLYADISPAITWSEPRNFRAISSLTFGIEMFFTD